MTCGGLRGARDHSAEVLRRMRLNGVAEACSDTGATGRWIAGGGAAMATTVGRRVKRTAIKGVGYHRILWPTDFSRLAKTALPHAVGLAADVGAELVLLHVLPSLAAYAPEVSGALSASLQRESRTAAQRELCRLEAHVKGHNIGCRRS